MNEIKELDNKYYVVKVDDVRLLSMNGQNRFEELLTHIEEKRKLKGKSPNKYVILNLDDDIDLKYLRSRILNAFDRPMGSVWRFRVRDIAVDLVNAILKAKRE